jgi:hypothetical protein
MITFRNPLLGIFDSIATLSRRYAFGSTFLKGGFTIFLAPPFLKVDVV